MIIFSNFQENSKYFKSILTCIRVKIQNFTDIFIFVTVIYHFFQTFYTYVIVKFINFDIGICFYSLLMIVTLFIFLPRRKFTVFSGNVNSRTHLKLWRHCKIRFVLFIYYYVYWENRIVSNGIIIIDDTRSI